MNPSIPASQFAKVVPGVIGAGGAEVALNGLFLTSGTRVPIGSVLSFPTAASVSSYFGPSAAETAEAAVYFDGFTGSTALPAALLFAQYNTAAVPAFLRGGNVSGLTVTQLEALSGYLLIAVNGTYELSSSISLSSSGTFSLAAAAIQSGFSNFAGAVTYDSVSGGFLFTTTATGGSETIGYAASRTGTSTASTTSGTTLTIGGTVTSTYAVGDVVIGTDSTNSLPNGCTITAILTGTGGAGTYTISAAATPGNLTSCTVDAYGPEGAFSTALGITAATGAVLSQGAAAATPAAFMTALVAVNNNWATFTTLFNPDVSGNANKLAFAAWNGQQQNLFAYVAWDADITPTESTDAASSLGQLLITNSIGGTVCIYEPSPTHLAAFLCGAVASIDFSQPNGATSLAYKSQSGLVPTVTSATVFANLIANGYNMYLTAATRNQQWTYFFPGSISGPFLDIMRYANQIWLNGNFVISLMDLQTTVRNLPYVQAGYTLIEEALQSDINQALPSSVYPGGFGMIQPGVQLSSQQIAEVNAYFGVNAAPALFAQGYYLQVVDPGSIVRGSSGSPAINFAYTDGGTVLYITLSSTDVI